MSLRKAFRTSKSDGADNFVSVMIQFINAFKANNTPALWRVLSSNRFKDALKFWYSYDPASYNLFLEKAMLAQERKDDE